MYSLLESAQILLLTGQRSTRECTNTATHARPCKPRTGQLGALAIVMAVMIEVLVVATVLETVVVRLTEERDALRASSSSVGYVSQWRSTSGCAVKLRLPVKPDVCCVRRGV